MLALGYLESWLRNFEIMELMINKIITQKAAATHTSKQMLDKLYLKSAYTLSLFVLKNALP